MNVLLLPLILTNISPIVLVVVVVILSHNNCSIKLKLSEGANQRARIRLREEGKQLKGQEQTQSEVKYELDDEAIGTEWTPVPIFISKYANTARNGVVLKISHVLEVTAIGTDSADFVNIPVTLG